MATGFDKGQAETVAVTFQITRNRNGGKREWTAINAHDFTVTFNPERGMWRVATMFGGNDIVAHGDTVDAAVLAALRVLIAEAAD